MRIWLRSTQNACLYSKKIYILPYAFYIGSISFITRSSEFGMYHILAGKLFLDMMNEIAGLRCTYVKRWRPSEVKLLYRLFHDRSDGRRDKARFRSWTKIESKKHSFASHESKADEWNEPLLQTARNTWSNLTGNCLGSWRGHFLSIDIACLEEPSSHDIFNSLRGSVSSSKRSFRWQVYHKIIAASLDFIPNYQFLELDLSNFNRFINNHYDISIYISRLHHLFH